MLRKVFAMDITVFLKQVCCRILRLQRTIKLAEFATSCGSHMTYLNVLWHSASAATFLTSSPSMMSLITLLPIL